MRWIEGVLFFMAALAASAGGLALFLAFVFIPYVSDPGTGENPWGLVVLAMICFVAAFGLFLGGRWAHRQ